MEIKRVLRDFPAYEISDQGYIVNLETGRRMAMNRNNRGIVTVGLTQNKVQYKRSLTLLMAETFVPRPSSSEFDTPINLDGDRTNNAASNIVWRPRWFAIEYFDQFETPDLSVPLTPVVDTKTDERYDDVFAAARKFGLLVKDIRSSIFNRTYTWPTYQVFTYVF